MIIGAMWITLGLLSRACERTWLGPASLFTLIFGISYIGTAVFAPEYRMVVSANMMLLIFSSSLLIGSFFGLHVFGVGVKVSKYRVTIISYNMRFLLSFGMICAIGGLVVLLSTLNVSIISLFNPKTFMRMAQTLTFNRYTAGLNLPIMYNILNAGLLSYAIVLGYFWALKGRIDPKYFVPLVIFALGNILITTRAPIIFGALLLGFGYVYGFVIKTGHFPRVFAAKAILIGGLSGVVVAGMFFYVQVLRFGEESQRSAVDVWAHLRRWPWGSLPGFSNWYEGTRLSQHEFPVGYFTFTGVLDNLGVASRVRGAYSEYIMLAPGEPGNIFTVFRGLMTDFGLAGALLFTALIGLGGGYAMAGARRGRVGFMALYVAVMCFISWSFVYSFFSYTSHLLALVAAPFLLVVLSRPASKTVIVC